jgi:hypothetical protein
MLGALAFGSLAGLKPGPYINLFGMTGLRIEKQIPLARMRRVRNDSGNYS